MKIYSQLAFGWRYNQTRHQAVIKKKSQVDFFLSIIIAFFVIFIVSQLLAHLDKSIRSPLNNDLSWLNPFKVQTALAANEEAMKMIQSQREINVVKGTGFTFEVGFKNLTNYTWPRMGKNSVDLKLAPPYDRDTAVRHQFWRDPATPAWQKDAQAKPGWLAYYEFALEAPKQAGVYTERFVLVNYSNGHILDGSEFEITLNVWDSVAQFPKTQARIVNQPASTTANPVTTNVQATPAVAVNSDVNKNLKVDDQGVALTDQVILGRTCLDLSVKRFRISTTDVTEKTIEDCKRIGIDLTANIYVDPLDNATSGTSPENNTVDNNSTPVDNQPSPEVNQTDNEPIVRIGLFYTTEPILIKANLAYVIKDKNQNVLANVSANAVSQITFNFSSKIYTLVANNQTTATSSYLRFESGNPNTVFEIASYENRPAWNTSLNDNKFLGKLEVRYASATDRLWVINELGIESYLKGLAESSNNSPLEYQKALLTAARTYAMYHYNQGTKHASENFTLDATYDQVYKGYGSQIRLPNVVTAVDQTRGQIVTYNGELAITPYFSYSDGRTRSWQEVWGGTAKPWLVSVKEPAGYTKTTLYGHGVGLSAYGAIMLAADYNYTFDQILKYYYTGTDLKKIY